MLTFLLQLKRTLDVATQQHQRQQQQQHHQRGSSSSSVLLILLQCALQAGKAARNTALVPELLELTKYGTGNNSKYDATPPRALVERVLAVARDRAVDPAVRDGVARIAVLARGPEIGPVRERALALARNAAERVRVQTLLHAPTLQLRDGVRVNVERIMSGIESELAVMRDHAL
jgi:hypothetical protein